MFKQKLNHYDYFSSESKSDINANERFKEKLDFLGLTQARRDKAPYLKDIYLAKREFILDNFYDRLLEIEDFKTIIHKYSTVERLKKTFDLHFLSLFEDALDLTYVFRRRKIAHTHARIGILPNWMISAYTLINQIIIPLIAKEFYNQPKKMLDTMLVYDSLVTIDQQIIVETYIEIQANSVVTGLGKMIKYNTDLDQIKELIQFQENQEKDVIQATASMEQLDRSIEEITGTIEDITDNTQSSFEKLNQDIEALQQVSALLQNTDEGQNAVHADVEKLVNRVNSVAKLMEFIKESADQTQSQKISL